MINQEKIGKLIVSLRKEKGMTQEQLAEQLGVSNRSVSRWENGKSLPELSLLWMIGKEFDVSVAELLNGERSEAAADIKQSIGLVVKLSEREKEEKAKKVHRYFLLGLFCIVLVLLHGEFGILNFVEEPEVLRRALLGVGIVCETAGFYCNRKIRRITEREIAILSGNEGSVRLETADEMLQFAKRFQPAELKQYKKAFEAICGKLLPGETVLFSMVANEYSANEMPGGLWHLGIAVTENRLLIGGEKITGRVMVRYGVDALEKCDIRSAELQNSKIVIRTSENEIKIAGEDLEKVIGSLKRVLFVQ